jgi:hypothetical protein
MFLRQFKGTGPGTIFLIIVTLLFIWASAFIKLKNHTSPDFDVNPMPLYGILSSFIGTKPLPGILLALAVVSLMAFLIVNLNTTLFFIHERTFLPALLYILLSGLFPQYQLLNPVIFAAIFLMLAIRRIMESYRIQGTAFNFFDAGILIGIGSLFYADLIWFGLLVLIGIALFRTGNIKEIAITVIGLSTPFILTFAIYYVLGKDLQGLVSQIKYNLFSKQDEFMFSPLTITAIIVAGLCVLVSIIHLLSQMNAKKIQARKIFSLLIWLLIISLAGYLVIPSVSVEIIWLAGIPVSFILTHYFVLARKKLVADIFFFLFFILIVLIQIRYLK